MIFCRQMNQPPTYTCFGIFSFFVNCIDLKLPTLFPALMKRQISCGFVVDRIR